MPDLATVTAFLGSIKTASDIARAIKGAELSLEKAEFKLKLADLIEALAEAKMQAADIQDILREKDDEISKLKKAFEFKSQLVRKGNAYYEKGNLPNSYLVEPYCSHCWEANQKAIHLIRFNSQTHGNQIGECPACKTKCLLEIDEDS